MYSQLFKSLKSKKSRNFTNRLSSIALPTLSIDTEHFYNVPEFVSEKRMFLVACPVCKMALINSVVVI